MLGSHGRAVSVGHNAMLLHWRSQIYIAEETELKIETMVKKGAWETETNILHEKH